jgi:hypothetical protein
MITSTLSTYFYASKFSQQPQASAFMQKASSNTHSPQDVFFKGWRTSAAATAFLLTAPLAQGVITSPSEAQTITTVSNAEQTNTIIDGSKGPLSTKDKYSGNYGKNTAHDYIDWAFHEKSTIGVTLRLTPKKSTIKQKIINTQAYSSFMAAVFSSNKKGSRIPKKAFVEREGFLLGSTLLAEKLFPVLDTNKDKAISPPEYMLYVNQAIMKTRLPTKEWEKWDGTVKVDRFWEAAHELTDK